ncbi:MAG: kynureninase [Pseudohongiellaceae bacterium]
MNITSPSLLQIKALDASDPLAAKRGEFLLPANTLYLNGNSLGPLTRQAQLRARQTVEQQWGEDLIASWNKHAWIDLPFTAAEKIAKLIGAAAGQLVCCDSVSINLLKLLAGSLHLQTPRPIILTQNDNFPSDLYVAQGVEMLLGSARCRLKAVTVDEIEEALSEEVAVLFLTEVNFRSGDRHDIRHLTSAAKAKGILVIWDLSHSAGVLPVQLDEWEVDFAVGCGYKYLNGGPGAPAFIYANKKHHDTFQQPAQGWMGHAEPFAFRPEYEKASGMAQFLTGTPAILSLATLDAALDVFADISITDIHEKATALAELFLQLVASDEDLKNLGLQSRAQASMRGAQLAFSHPNGYGICRALNEAGIVVDFRSPDLIRFGFSPLFLRFEDIWAATRTLKKVMLEKTYLAEKFSQKLRVT